MRRNPLRSHVEREINEAEAAVVRRIFALYDAGEGLKRIAKQPNSEGALSPKPFVRKDPTKVLQARRTRRLGQRPGRAERATS